MVPNAINGNVHLLDGIEQLQTFKSAGVPCVDFIIKPPPTDLGNRIYLGRKAEHTQGFDIRASNLPKERGKRSWTNSDYFTLYEPDVVREWRFHIFRGQSIARSLKVWTGTNPEPTNHPIIRARRLGWHMRHDVKPAGALRELAKQAVEAVDYELGAVDLLELSGKVGKVLEVNSRPAIRDNYTLGAYERAFRGAV